VKIGDVLPLEKSRDDDIEGLTQILPIRTNGDEGCWQVGPNELKNRIQQGRVRLGKETAYGFVVNYLPDG
jgi:adenine-specific DNA-methyltransferase